MDFSTLNPGDEVEVTMKFTVDDVFLKHPYGYRITTTSGSQYYEDDFEFSAQFTVNGVRNA